MQTKIAASAAAIGLLILAVSPLFHWVKFANGGVIGLKGDGKFVLGINFVAIAIYIAFLINPKWLKSDVLAIQAWDTVAVFWIAALIWNVSSIFDLPGLKDNPFAGLLAAQINPGAGLYLALLGALVVAAGFGFVAVRRLLAYGGINAYLATQGLSVALGVLLAFFVGPSSPTRHNTAEVKDPDLSWAFPGVRKAADRADAQTKWKKTHNVSDEQWDELIANYKGRKRPTSVSEMDWWEEAKDKTPVELNKLYPPLQPKEWYRAEWPGQFSFSRSRELDFNFSDRTQKLKVTVMITTESDVPIKELHGHLAFVKDNEIIYETQLAEKPDVSFTDTHFVLLRIDYDDNNSKHRTLRFAKDDELTPVFTVRKVVLANGVEKTFEEETHEKQEDLAPAKEKELAVLNAKADFPSIAGVWQEGPEENQIRATVTQNADKFTATCTYHDKEHGEISWRMTGTISSDGEIKGSLVHTKAPRGWLNQTRTGKFSSTDGTITGQATFQGGAHDFEWRRLDN
jgi:hypothetical protein